MGSHPDLIAENLFSILSDAVLIDFVAAIVIFGIGSINASSGHVPGFFIVFMSSVCVPLTVPLNVLLFLFFLLLINYQLIMLPLELDRPHPSATIIFIFSDVFEWLVDQSNQEASYMEHCENHDDKSEVANLPPFVVFLHQAFHVYADHDEERQRDVPSQSQENGEA